MVKKFLLGLATVAVVVSGVAVMSAFEAHVINVTAQIENALSVTPDEIMFGTVFPQEHLFRNLKIALSESFLLEDRADDVEYTITQKPKCTDGEGNYYPVDPVDHDCGDGDPLPLLCPYISLTSEDEEGDNSLPAFHTDCGSATGVLVKSEQDTEDEWVVDLAVPCFKGQCAQDYYNWVKSINQGADPWYFILSPEDEHEIFGCDLWVEVTGVSRNYIDRVDIGDETSEAGHNLSWWGPIEPTTNGGGWGGIAPGTCRVIYAPTEDGENGNPEAYVTLDFGPEPVSGERYLVLRNLDGQANWDDFDVYLNGNKYAYYEGQTTSEDWKTTYAVIDEFMPSIIEVKLVSTNEQWSSWGTYGQVGFDWIMTTNTIPDGAEQLGYYSL